MELRLMMINHKQTQSYLYAVAFTAFVVFPSVSGSHAGEVPPLHAESKVEMKCTCSPCGKPCGYPSPLPPPEVLSPPPPPPLLPPPPPPPPVQPYSPPKSYCPPPPPSQYHQSPPQQQSPPYYWPVTPSNIYPIDYRFKSLGSRRSCRGWSTSLVLLACSGLFFVWFTV